MDLLEYQGKQLFARHGIPVPGGQPARTVDEAVAAAEEIGYPCVVKAQVKIGGRGKAGGIKIAEDEDEAREHADAHPRHGHQGLHGPRGLDRGRVGDRGRVLRRRSSSTAAPRRRWSCSPRRAAWTSRRSPTRTPTRSRRCTSTRCSASRTSTAAGSPSRPASTPTSCARSARSCTALYAAFVAEEAMLVEVNPLIVTPDARRRWRSTRRSRSTTTRSSATPTTPSCATPPTRTRRSRWPRSAG